MAYKPRFLEKLNFLCLDWAIYLAPNINRQGKFMVKGLRGK